MKIFLKNILVTAAALSTVVACDLNLLPSTSVPYEEGGVIFSNKEDVKSFRAGLYANYRALQGGDFAAPEEIQLDGFNAHIDYGNNYGPLHRMNQDFTTGDYDVEDFWAGNYTAIKNYNIVIANAYNLDDESLYESARLVKGEAHFFRASSYINLAHHFAKAYCQADPATELCVPLVLVYNQNEKPARATIAQVYEAIKADLDSAAVILADQAGAVRADRITIDAVNAVYARYYLDVKEYAKAAEAAMSVINSEAGYKLASNEKEFYDEFVDDKGKEAIIQLYASITEAPNATTCYTGLGADSNVAEGYYLMPYFLPTKSLLDLYEEKDLRGSKWFGNATIIQSDTLALPVRCSGSYYYDIKCFIKFAGNPALSSKSLQSGYNAPKPIRLSEMYLIAAEAYFLDSKTAEASAILAELQQARGANSKPSCTLADIQKEWRKETVGEGFRLDCLKRWGLGFSGRTPQQAALEHAAIMESPKDLYTEKTIDASCTYLNWPIPLHEMKINKNLVQNPGY